LRKSMVIALLLAVLAIVSVAGCGDSEDGGGGTAEQTAASSPAADSGEGGGEADSEAPESDSPTIGKAEFIKKADAICYRVSAKIATTTSAALAKFSSDPAALKGASVDLVPTLFVPRIEEAVAEIRALGTPPGDEDQVNAFVDALQSVADQAEEDPKAFAYADFTKPAENPYQEADELADKYGFKKCPRV
jgi:hypothetical protein